MTRHRQQLYLNGLFNLLKKILKKNYVHHQLTGEDILFKNSNISVPIGPAVLMKEANSVAKFVDDISHLTP